MGDRSVSGASITIRILYFDCRERGARAIATRTIIVIGNCDLPRIGIFGSSRNSCRPRNISSAIWMASPYDGGGLDGCPLIKLCYHTVYCVYHTVNNKLKI